MLQEARLPMRIIMCKNKPHGGETANAKAIRLYLPTAISSQTAPRRVPQLARSLTPNYFRIIMCFIIRATTLKRQRDKNHSTKFRCRSKRESQDTCFAGDSRDTSGNSLSLIACKYFRDSKTFTCVGSILRGTSRERKSEY